MSDKVFVTNKTGHAVTIAGEVVEHLGRVKVDRTTADEVKRVHGWITMEEVKPEVDETAAIEVKSKK